MTAPIEFVWHFTDLDADAAADECLDALCQSDQEAQITRLTPAAGLFPVDVAAAIAGVAGITAIVARIANIVCRVKKHGIIIDARGGPLTIRETTQVPGGTIVTITGAGTQTVHDACASDSDLPSIISNLVAGQERA